MKERTAVITGGSRGIGKAIAIAFAKAGVHIAIVDWGDKAEGNAVAETCRNMGVKAQVFFCDVSHGDAVKEVADDIVKTFDGVDILVNNAGITKDNLILRMSEEDFTSVVNVNLTGAFHFIKYLSRSIMKSPKGRIINITSVSGITGNPGQANYSASKAGMIGLTKTVAKEFAGRGVTCNAIAPGFIKTDMTAKLSETVLESAIKEIPLKRMGNAEEIAALAVFLGSDSASYITGEVIKIDGGMCI